MGMLPGKVSFDYFEGSVGGREEYSFDDSCTPVTLALCSKAFIDYFAVIMWCFKIGNILCTI